MVNDVLASMQYIQKVKEIFKKVEETQLKKILMAAEIISDCMIDGGVLHAFGTSHSHILCQEIFERAGGFASVNCIGMYSITKSSGISGQVERLEGYATVLLDYHGISKNDIMLVVSNSGTNPTTVEAALVAKERGLKVIAITSIEHTKAFPSRHSSGKRLFEISDIVIDNCGIAGDAILKLDGIKAKVSSTSTVVGVFIINTMMAQVAQNMIEKGVEPPILMSYTGYPGVSSEELEKHKRELFSRYSSKIIHYFQYRKKEL